jgi:lipopolysaccharide transport system ATP-binding protein
MFSNDNDVAIRVTNLSKCYEIYASPRDRLKQFIFPRLQRKTGRAAKQYFREFWALKNISFEIKKGETFAIIGRNGSGKSTLLQMICGTLNPTSGNIQTNGRVAALLELGAGFNPEFTGRENVYLNASVLGLSIAEIDERFDTIAAFADIGEFIEQPIKTYSSGMMVRLAFAVAIHVDPEILIVDEALSVGDAYFQAKCAKMIQNIIATGATVLFVSHDTSTVKSLCSRALLLDAGENQYIGEVNTAVEKYYSALVASQRAEKKSVDHEVTYAESSSNVNLENENFQTMANFQRIQNGAATFLNVLLLNEQGQSVEAIDFGQRVTLRQIIRINASIPKLGFAYHIRDKNGQDIIYSDTGIEANSHIVSATIGSVHVVDWTFTVRLREGNYTISSMASEPANLNLGEVVVIDFVPISLRFSVGRGQHLPIYAAAYWENAISLQEIKNNE